MLPFFFQLLDAIFDLGKIFKIESIDLRTFFANIESLVIKRAEELALKYDLSSLAHFRCVKPGPLDIPDESVDLVFSKEVFLHIPNKDDLINEILEEKEIIIEEKLEEWLAKEKQYPEIMKKFTRYLEKKENDVVLDKIKDEVKLVLFNNRNIIKS